MERFKNYSIRYFENLEKHMENIACAKNMEEFFTILKGSASLGI